MKIQLQNQIGIINCGNVTATGQLPSPNPNPPFVKLFLILAFLYLLIFPFFVIFDFSHFFIFMNFFHFFCCFLFSCFFSIFFENKIAQCSIVVYLFFSSPSAGPPAPDFTPPDNPKCRSFFVRPTQNDPREAQTHTWGGPWSRSANTKPLPRGNKKRKNLGPHRSGPHPSGLPTLRPLLRPSALPDSTLHALSRHPPCTFIFLFFVF